MWIKICGNTRLEDCLLAAELGADAVGFVFAQSKRKVSAEQVAEITRHLPPSLERFGVFTSGDAEEIAYAAVVAGLTGVQLHRTYDPRLVEDLRSRLTSRPTRILQVLQWNVDAAAADQADSLTRDIRRATADGMVDALLLDSCTTHGSGGTGKAFDWQAVRPLLRNSGLPVIAAGGLTPWNITDAIAALQPAGVDVSSGVESAPGVKDAAKLHGFLAVARS